MISCISLDLQHRCPFCRSEYGVDNTCFIESYKDLIKRDGFMNAFWHVKSFPENTQYLRETIKYYYDGYVDRLEKMLILL